MTFLKTAVIIGFGGFLGSISRYAVQVISSRFISGDFPYGTLIVNIIGCFLIGLLFGLAEREQLLSPQLKLFLLVGFVGSFTTFSTFSMDKLILIQNGNYAMMFGYMFLSIMLGLAGTISGLMLVKKLF